MDLISRADLRYSGRLSDDGYEDASSLVVASSAVVNPVWRTPRWCKAMVANPLALLALVLPASLVAAQSSGLTCDSPELASRLYCNASAPIDARIESLLGLLTMNEKTASVLESGKSVPRLGVPTLGSTECLRGYLSMFPQALAMSQAWNISLVRAVASATADEVRGAANGATGGAGGALACFDPVLNVCRDPRWGRCELLDCCLFFSLSVQHGLTQQRVVVFQARRVMVKILG
eukprot:COSAG06_NODE_831_length_12041_cov_5.766789_14_plen_234_part_00